jgi:hypothetical protein
MHCREQQVLLVFNNNFRSINPMKVDCSSDEGWLTVEAIAYTTVSSAYKCRLQCFTDKSILLI